jgi:EAL domain-containing protein (putative c-di-GMP-specific phosphodiesterase class I)
MARGPALRQRDLIFAVTRLATLVGRRDRESNLLPDVDLEILDTSRLVSRRHAELRVRDGQVVVVDVGAANGVWVNGARLEPLTERDLQDGDAVTFGDVTLVFASDAKWPEGVVAEWEPAAGAQRRSGAERTMTFGNGVLGQLAPALARQEFILHYQPKVSLATGRIEAVEGLVRWRHPQLGLLAPDQFVHVAEQNALVKVLTQTVLAIGIQQSKEWMAAGIDVTVAINLAVQDLEDARFPGKVADLLAASRLPGERLQVEITETGVMGHREQALRSLSDLRGLGLQVAIDDFGIGHSSLAYLKDLPATELKTDQSFCRDLDENDQIILRSAIALGHALGLHVTAEGVETERSVELLRAMGCDSAQGYHFGKPMPAEEMTARLRSQARGWQRR